MKTKRLISLLLAAVFALSAAATPALAASAGSELTDLTTAGVDENNSVVSIRPDPFGQDPHPAQNDPPAEKDVGEP